LLASIVTNIDNSCRHALEAFVVFELVKAPSEDHLTGCTVAASAVRVVSSAAASTSSTWGRTGVARATIASCDATIAAISTVG
jgi:hypothetical protein